MVSAATATSAALGKQPAANPAAVHRLGGDVQPRGLRPAPEAGHAHVLEPGVVGQAHLVEGRVDLHRRRLGAHAARAARPPKMRFAWPRPVLGGAPEPAARVELSALDRHVELTARFASEPDPGVEQAGQPHALEIGRLNLAADEDRRAVQVEAVGLGA